MFSYSHTNKRYHTLDHYYRTKYNKKIVRLVLNIGADCPRPKGHGCHFCDYIPSKNHSTIQKQYQEQREIILKKRPDAGIIAYLQQGSNTYNNKTQLQEALEFLLTTDAIAVIIATRPDCIDEETLQMLANYPKEIYLELGLQTTFDESAMHFNRGYDFHTFLENLYLIKKYKFNVTIHLINGLINESREQMIENAKIIGKLPADMIKIHYLVIPTKSYYGKQNIKPTLTDRQFIDVTIEQLRYLPTNIVIARLTTDIDDINTAQYSKINILNSIDKIMARNDFYQGDLLLDLPTFNNLYWNEITNFSHAIDATGGNGKDTARLAERFSKVTFIDIQELAIRRSKKNLEQFSNIDFYQDNFKNIQNYIKEDTSLIIYNLGFLPGSDHCVTTATDSAKSIINAAKALIFGIIAITAYTRHQGGYQELIAIQTELNRQAIKYQILDGLQTHILIRK